MIVLIEAMQVMGVCNGAQEVHCTDLLPVVAASIISPATLLNAVNVSTQSVRKVRNADVVKSTSEREQPLPSRCVHVRRATTAGVGGPHFIAPHQTD